MLSGRTRHSVYLGTEPYRMQLRVGKSAREATSASHGAAVELERAHDAAQLLDLGHDVAHRLLAHAASDWCRGRCGRRAETARRNDLRRGGGDARHGVRTTAFAALWGAQWRRCTHAIVAAFARRERACALGCSSGCVASVGRRRLHRMLRRLRMPARHRPSSSNAASAAGLGTQRVGSPCHAWSGHRGVGRPLLYRVG